MIDSTISWMLSGLSYDEDHIVEYVTSLLGKGFRADFQGADDGSHFYGIVINENTGKVWLVNRGTDGYDIGGNLRSWIYDANIFTGDDGVHNGFQALGDRAFNDLKHYLWSVDEVVCTGHSQGAGVSPYQACLCIENITSLKHVHFDLFGDPPTGNQIFFDRVQRHTDNNKISGDRYVNMDDPISSPFLRRESSILLNGKDVGREIALPKFISFNIGPAKLINHSCRTYNFLMMMLYAQMQYHHEEDYGLLGKIHNLLVN